MSLESIVTNNPDTNLVESVRSEVIKRGGFRVFLVDDDFHATKIFSDFLTNYLACNVTVANDGLSFIDKASFNYDLALVDLKLSENQDVLPYLSQIKESKPNFFETTPWCLLSAFDDGVNNSTLIQDYRMIKKINKPFHLSDLVSFISHFINRGKRSNNPYVVSEHYKSKLIDTLDRVGCADLGLKVLVVDDSETARQVFSDQFKSIFDGLDTSKFICHIASSSEELVEAMSEQKYDFAFLDFKLGNTNAEQCLTHIRTLFSEGAIHYDLDKVNIFYVTGYKMTPSEYEREHMLGVKKTLHKDITADDLALVIALTLSDNYDSSYSQKLSIMAERFASLMIRTSVHDISNLLMPVLGFLSFLDGKNIGESLNNLSSDVNLALDSKYDLEQHAFFLQNVGHKISNLVKLQVDDKFKTMLKGVDNIRHQLDVLSLFYRPKAQIVDVDLVKVVTGPVNKLKSRYEKVNFNLEICDKSLIPTFKGVESGLAYVVLDLGKNAVEADAKNVLVKLDVLTDNLGKYVQIIVTDDGCGISESDVDKIFLPNYSSKSSKDSYERGNGLTLVSDTAKYHDATITVESKVGKGSKFTFKKYV